MPSYHDLHVTTAKIPRTSIFSLPFSYDVRCCRTAGWQLWQLHGAGNEELLAGEYDNGGLRLDVGGAIICDSLDPFMERSSFPFLSIARRRSIPYGEVVRFVQGLDICPSMSVDITLLDWQQEAVAAWSAERRRRVAVEQGI